MFRLDQFDVCRGPIGLVVGSSICRCPVHPRRIAAVSPTHTTTLDETNFARSGAYIAVRMPLRPPTFAAGEGPPIR